MGNISIRLSPFSRGLEIARTDNEVLHTEKRIRLNRLNSWSNIGEQIL